MADNATARKCSPSEPHQEWNRYSRPLIFNALKTRADHLQRKGKSASATKLLSGDAYVLTVDGQHLSFQYESTDRKIYVRETAVAQPPHLVEAAPIQNCTAEWVDKHVGRFRTLPDARLKSSLH
jgi:hypothetical protein